MTDNPGLSRDQGERVGATDAPARRPRPERETPEIAAMVRRVLRSLVRRAAAGDLDALGELVGLQRETAAAILQAARGLHAAPGNYSWTEIAQELDMTRQAARQRFGQPGAE